ncbi:hypothetical protein QYE76_063337 [Lolium multiflorum]|uniref:Uncharacterized protein n=1 Tax=Lolium multiflorum TaxID=4521 RepID=A0AAD8S4T1_LOLMU|nr:hypothetical protein QYE76_063337 [Lolium multiflorum]
MWKKKSIFWELEYWKVLDVRSAIDVMHVTKNICMNLLSFLGVYGKTNDTKEARQDQQRLKDPDDRHPEWFQGRASYARPKKRRIIGGDPRLSQLDVSVCALCCCLVVLYWDTRRNRYWLVVSSQWLKSGQSWNSVLRLAEDSNFNLFSQIPEAYSETNKVSSPAPWGYRLCGAENTREKELSGGRESGEIPPEGEIDVIAIVIELDIISIIIIIISTIYNTITTAAPRHRCNNLGISMNEVRKKLFTISLSGKAAHWYKLLKNGDSIDWEDIVPLFYSKFYPPSEIHKDRNRIYNFWPHDGESIAQAWGRLKSLMLKCPIHELSGNVIIDNFYARLSFQDKTLLDTSCSGSFTRNKEEFKRDLLDRIQENTEGWENDKDRESCIIYDYKCIEAFMDTDKFRNMSATYGLDSQVVANLYKAFASHYELPKKNFDKYHEPYKDKIDSSVNKCVVIETVDNVIPEAYIEKTHFPAKMKEYSVISSVVNKSEKKPKEPEEQIKIEPAVAIVKDLVTENVEDGHIIFCEDASNIVSHPNKPKQVSVPMLSVRIGDHCYYGLCDIGASVSAIPYELYTEIMHEIGSCELEDIDVVIHLANRETISPIGIVRDVEVLCGAVLGQRVDKKLNVIHYASKTLDAAQRNYATTEKELSTMVSNNKDKGPWKEEMDERINKEKKKIASAKGDWETTKSRPILVGSVNTGRSFSHNLQGALPPALDLDSFPCVEEAIRVADEFCDQYRALKREVEILQEENQRLRRMLEY